MYESTFLSILIISLFALATGRTIISSVNGGTVGLRNVSSNNPVKDVNSQDMVCGLGSQPSSGPLSILAGGTLKLTYFHNANEAIAASHQGPCIAYIAEASNPTRFSKFFEDGYDASGKSCITRRLGTTRSLTLNLPNDLKPGNYIVRSELIALHQADGPPPERGAEFYIQCIDINVTGRVGAASVGVGSNAVTIPGYLTQDSPGVLFNIYVRKVTNYTIPGPPIDPAFTFGAQQPPNNAPPSNNTSPLPEQTATPTNTLPPIPEITQQPNPPQNTTIVVPPLDSPPPPAERQPPQNVDPASEPPSNEIGGLFLSSEFVLRSSAESQSLHRVFNSNFVILAFVLNLLYH